ncbi:MAG TPA: hypothetical protein VNB24_07895 [Acidimicrobiales bacterium]|nr:hypothetical protein [Acidimicrobiales bacterium]
MNAVELRAGPASVRIFPDEGGRLGQIEVDGTRLLRGEEFASLGWSQWGSYPLLPWSNRIPGGRFTFDGRVCQVPVNRDDNTAIHGLVAWVPWSLVAADERSATIEVRATEGCYDVLGSQTFTVSPTHLDQTLAVTNLSDAVVPVGLGIHPWFVAGEVRVPADRMWPGDTPIPTGPPVLVDAGHDLRTPRVPPPMDRCFTELSGTTAEVPGLHLSWTGPVTQIVVYSGTPGWVCVEPVTMANDGFGLAERGIDGHGVVGLSPGETCAVAYRFAWSAS